MLGAYTAEGWPYKLACDGLDLSRSKVGEQVLNHIALEYIEQHGTVGPDFDAETFIRDCVSDRRANEPEHKLNIYLRDKYEVGQFVVAAEGRGDRYALFNSEELRTWEATGVNLLGLRFLVVPSRDQDGRINEIGLRLLDTSLVYDAFKWLFPFGQQATFGLDKCDGRPIVCVEGAFDQIAFAESGVQNVVGLGSIFLTKGHQKYLAGRQLTMCLDQDRFGLSQRANYASYCFYRPEGKDPFDVFLQHGRVELVEVA